MNKISGRIITIFCSVCCAFFIVSCGQGCNNVSTSVSDTQTAIRKELSPEEKYSFLFEKGAPPLPDTPAEFLPRLPDIVVAPDLYQKKATFFTRLPFGGLTLSGEGEELGDYSCAINEKNYIVLLEEMGSVLVVISPEGKYLYEMPSRESTVFVRDSKGNIMGVSDDNPDQDIFLGIEGPIVFISDSVCVFQIGYQDITAPKPNLAGEYLHWYFSETVVEVNIYSRQIVSMHHVPVLMDELIRNHPDTSPYEEDIIRLLPDWHPVTILRKLESGEAEYPPMKWRVGIAPIWEIADPGPGRGYFAQASRFVGETNPKVTRSGPWKQYRYLEAKENGKRYFLDAGGAPFVGQTIDGKAFRISGGNLICGYALYGNEIAQTEQYVFPSTDDPKHPRLLMGFAVSPTGRVIQVYRTYDGVEIFKAERPKKVERRRSR